MYLGLFKRIQCLTHCPQGDVTDFKSLMFTLILWINILSNSCKIIVRRMPQNSIDNSWLFQV